MRARGPLVTVVVAAALALAAPALAAEDPESGGRFGGFALPAPALQLPQDPGTRPPMDPVGGFQLSIIGGVQLRGTASGQGGLAFAYFKRSTASVGIELEAAFNRGPSGEVVHAIGSIILQSGARSAKLVPYLSLGGGVFQAREKLRQSIKDELPNFGIDPVEREETGPLIGFGFGVRYYLRDNVSFRADYREFRALTGSDSGFFDRLFALRRIAGFLSFDL